MKKLFGLVPVCIGIAILLFGDAYSNPISKLVGDLFTAFGVLVNYITLVYDLPLKKTSRTDAPSSNRRDDLPVGSASPSKKRPPGTGSSFHLPGEVISPSKKRPPGRGSLDFLPGEGISQTTARSSQVPIGCLIGLVGVALTLLGSFHGPDWLQGLGIIVIMMVLAVWW